MGSKSDRDEWGKWGRGKTGGEEKKGGVGKMWAWHMRKCGHAKHVGVTALKNGGVAYAKNWGGGIWGRGMCEQWGLSLASSCRSLVRASHRSLR